MQHFYKYSYKNAQIAGINNNTGTPFIVLQSKSTLCWFVLALSNMATLANQEKPDDSASIHFTYLGDF